MQEQLKALPISDIYPNPFQPRIEFSDEELAELSQSISENGLIQPIIVRKSDIIGYELIAGERRLRACKRLGMTEIPAVVKEAVNKLLLKIYNDRISILLKKQRPIVV